VQSDQEDTVQDASRNIALNGVRIESQQVADKLRVPVGEIVPWAKAFPRTTATG
jgi:hypothetical protein